MQTEREWLADRGLAKPGVRGRFSLAAKEALAKARQEGVQFADTPAQAAAKPARQAAKEDKPQPEGQNYTHFELPSGMFRFYVGDQEITEKTACCNCGVSLVVCHCQVPRVVWIKNRGNLAEVRRRSA